MENKTNVWQVLGIIFIVLTAIFFISTATLTTLYVLSNHDVHQLVEKSEDKEDKIVHYRKRSRKYKEKEVEDYKNSYNYDDYDSSSSYDD